MNNVIVESLNTTEQALWCADICLWWFFGPLNCICLVRASHLETILYLGVLGPTSQISALLKVNSL